MNKLIVTQARKHLVDFEIATNPNYKVNWHHDIIGKELEHIEFFGDRDYKILVLSVPPRHGKSLQCSIDFPAWFLGRNPSNEIIIASYSADLAQDFGGKTREKVDGQEFRTIFPEIRIRADEKAKGKWGTMIPDPSQQNGWKIAGGSYTAVGVGGPITGRGANILLIDDPIKNREEAESEVVRDKIWDWFTSTAFTRLEPKGVAIVIMTRWHQDDLVGRILAHPELSKRTKSILFPAIKDGEPLWGGKYTIEALNEIKSTIGPYDWSALYQGQPILTENQEFKGQWIKYMPEVNLPMMNTRNFLTIDTAMSQKTTADFTGFCDNSINQENFWHLKAWRMKIGPEELINNIFTLHQSRNYEAIGIEKTAYLSGLKPYLDMEQRRRDKFLPIVELQHNQTQKEIRIRGLIPRYASGSVFHVEGRCKDLEEEMFNFPLGTHDDVLDAVAYQLQIADNPRIATGVTVNLTDYSVD